MPNPPSPRQALDPVRAEVLVLRGRRLGLGRGWPGREVRGLTQGAVGIGPDGGRGMKIVVGHGCARCAPSARARGFKCRAISGKRADVARMRAAGGPVKRGRSRLFAAALPRVAASSL